MLEVEFILPKGEIVGEVFGTRSVFILICHLHDLWNLARKTWGGHTRDEEYLPETIPTFRVPTLSALDSLHTGVGRG